MALDERLHLVLTNPRELDEALSADWPSAREIVDAIRLGDYQVLFADDTGQKILDRILSEIARLEGAAHG